jgi:CheY-like chemotaxis protein
MDLGDVGRDYIHCIKASGEALLGLINDILDFSKIEAGKIEIEPEDFMIETAIDDLLATLQTKALEKNLEFVGILDPGVPRLLYADAYRLKQILTNLIGNALKFTSTGSVVLTVAWEPTGELDGWLVARVEDTGIGIPYDRQQEIFESFAQAETNTSKQFGGSGLGLTISRELTILMGGDLNVSSSPGVGSTFECRIPISARPPKVEGARTGEKTGDAPRSGKCLIVGETLAGIASLSAILQSFGFSICVARDLKTIKSLPSDIHTILVRDEWLSDRDPEQVFVHECKMSPLQIFVTTQDFRRSEGPVTYLSKPFRHIQVKSLLLGNANREKRLRSDLAFLSGKRFLVVEDNTVNQKIMLGFLARGGAIVDVASDGDQGVHLARAHRYDLIFMDCQMPVMDGYEATKEIRKLEQGMDRQSTIVAMTANAMSGDREMCLDAGMDEYLTKPITPDALYNLVSRLVSLTHSNQRAA